MHNFDHFEEIHIPQNIDSCINSFKETYEKETLEIYSIKSNINSTMRENTVLKEENEKIFKEINDMISLEVGVFENSYSIIENDAQISEEISKAFQEIDELLTENLKINIDLNHIDQEHFELNEKKSQLDQEYVILRSQIEEIQRIWDENFPQIEEENKKREENAKLLENEIFVQNEEIAKFQAEKRKIIEEYEAKLNLKNIRYELEMDDYLRNKGTVGSFGTEIKPKTITKSKYSDVKMINEECQSKKNIKFI